MPALPPPYKTATYSNIEAGMNPCYPASSAMVGATKDGLRLRLRAKLEHCPKPVRYAGFTLIELSIVFVIIGLIVGGVLVGNDLIEAAKQRRLIGQVEELKIQIRMFKDRYRALPGDMRNTSGLLTLSFGTGAGIGADNDGIIETGHEANASAEMLSASGLVKKSYLHSFPTNTIGPGGNAIETAYDGVGLLLTNNNKPSYVSDNSFISVGKLTTSQYLVNGAFSATIAKEIDTKIDSGEANTGKWWASNDGGAVCVDGSNHYNLTTNGNCRVQISLY